VGQPQQGREYEMWQGRKVRGRCRWRQRNMASLCELACERSERPILCERSDLHGGRSGEGCRGRWRDDVAQGGGRCHVIVLYLVPLASTSGAVLHVPHPATAPRRTAVISKLTPRRSSGRTSATSTSRRRSNCTTTLAAGVEDDHAIGPEALGAG
jgi:hypothetical protein